jgi:hypothetical protein
MLGIKIKKMRGRTWANCDSEDVITQEFLQRIGRLLVKSIVFEARKDFARQGGTHTPRGDPEGIPDSEAFYKSFKFKTTETSVEIYCSWPFIEQITEGRRPYPMDWLTRQAGVSHVPMKGSDGTVLIRTTPAGPEDAWIHPGFRKNNFVRRGYERARHEMDEMLRQQIAETLKKMPLA